MKPITLSAGLVAGCAVVVLGWLLLSGESSPPQAGSPPSPPAAQASRSDALLSAIRKDLTDADWSPEAAEAVVRLNAGWFRVLETENPQSLQIQVTLLKGLGRHAGLGGFLAEYPETAGLLAGVEDPMAVADTLKDAGDDYPLFAGLYMRHAAPADATALARALATNRERIRHLTWRGLVGTEVLFLFDRQDEGARVYERWLQEVLDARLSRSDEELASLVHLLLNQGPALLGRLRQDEPFRDAFRHTLWPRLVRVVSSQQHMFEPFLDEPHLWELLALPHGERLLAGWGKLAVALLYGKNAYPPALHEQVLQALLNDDKLAVEALAEFHDQPLFRRLLERPPPGCNSSTAGPTRRWPRKSAPRRAA
jgi:hypothetical protein